MPSKRTSAAWRPRWYLLARGTIPRYDRYRAELSIAPEVMEVYTVPLEGREVADWAPGFVVRPESSKYDGEPGTVLVSGWVAPIVHRRVREALGGAGIRDVQFLPVRVEHLDGTPIPEYFILNITACLNPVRDPDPMPRVLERIGDRSTWADRVILPGNLLEAHDALRSRPWEPTVYVSQRLKDALKPVLLRELAFIPVAVA